MSKSETSGTAAPAGPSWAELGQRGVIAVSGTDARSFLQALISTDVEKVSPGRAIYGALLTPQGKFLHDFFIAELDGRLLMDCDAGRQDDLLRRLTMYRLRAEVELEPASGGFTVAALMTGAGGAPGAARPLGGGVAFVDPRLAALGERVILPAESARAVLEGSGLEEATFEDYEQLRISLGVPDAARDLIVEKSLLLESNFEELNGVDFEKGCYVGQEVTSRTKYRGLVRKRLFRVDVTGALPPAGTKVTRGEANAGTMCGGLGQSGLALLRLEQVAEADGGGPPLIAGGAEIKPVRPDWADF